MMDIKIKSIVKGHYFYGILCAVISFIVYLLTLAPTVYWGDSGELITVAYTLGIAHPSGYPTWTLLGHLFTYLPFGSVAWRVNLMSAVFGSLAVMLLYFVCWKVTKSKIASFTASLIFGFSATFWSQAVIAEVYTMHAFFMALNILILLHWREKQDAGDPKHIKWLYLFSFTYGLSLTHHLTSVLLFPGFAYFILVKKHEKWFKVEWNKEILNLKTIGICVGLLLVGLLPYAYLPIRSSMDPVMDWGNPETLENFVGHVSGGQYSFLRFYFLNDVTSLWKTLPFSLRALTQDFNLVLIMVFFFSLVGAYCLLKTHLERSIMFLMIILPIYLNNVGYIIPDIEVYYIPIFMLMCVFAAGSIKILNEFTAKKAGWIILLLLIIILTIVFQNFPLINLSSEYAYKSYDENVIKNLNSRSFLIIIDSMSDFSHEIYVEKSNNVTVFVTSMAGSKVYLQSFMSEGINLNLNNITKSKANLTETKVKYLLAEKIIHQLSGKEKIYLIDSVNSNPNINNPKYELAYRGLFYEVVGGTSKIPLNDIKYNLVLPKNDLRGDAKTLKKIYSNLYFKEAVNQLKVNNTESAVNLFIQAVNLNNDLSEANYNLAALYYNAGEFELAYTYAKKAYASNPNDNETKSLLSMIGKRIKTGNAK